MISPEDIIFINHPRMSWDDFCDDLFTKRSDMAEKNVLNDLLSTSVRSPTMFSVSVAMVKFQGKKIKSIFRYL